MNQCSFTKVSECQALLHERKAPPLKAFWCISVQRHFCSCFLRMRFSKRETLSLIATRMSACAFKRFLDFVLSDKSA